MDNSLTRWKKLKFSKIRNSRNSQNSVWKPNFFLGALHQIFFCFYSSYTGDTPYRVWFDLDNSLTRWKKLKFSKIRNSRNSQNSVWKPNFFLGALHQIFFCFYSSYTGDTPYRVWFDLDNSLTRWKKIKILKISQFAKFAKFRMKTQLFPRRAQPKFFLLFTLITLVILHTAFGLIWTTPWPAEKKIKILKISQFAKFAKFRMKTQLFPRRAQPKIFLLFTLITLVILHTAFGLIWTTPWPDEKNLLKFSKFRNSRNSQNSVWKPNFFPRQALPIFFLLYTVIALVILNTDFGLIWTTRWPDEKKIKILKNSQFAKFAKFRMKTQLFLGTLYQKFFCFTLSLHWWYSIPRLIWFGQLLDPLKKN